MEPSTTQRILEPRQLTVLTTSKCTAACRHCCMNSTPDRDETLTWEQLEDHLKQAFDNFRLRVVIFAGGEPMLLGETLYKAIRYCKRRGAVTRIVTNAYWAANRTHAQKKLDELRAAGLDELNLSTDDYHTDFIKIEAVNNAYQLAQQMDFSAVVLANCFGPQSEMNPEHVKKTFGGDMTMRYDDDGAALELKQKRGKQLVVLSNARLQRLGKGYEGLREDELAPMTAEQLDDLGDSTGGCPWAVRSPAISAKGHFVACCGFEVEDNPILDYGDLAKTPMKDLVNAADNDLLTNMIALLGPIRIMRLLQEVCPDEISFPRSYRTYCEVCSDLVTIKQNRDALYKHGGKFANLVLEAREYLRDNYRSKGVVDYPPLKVTLEKPPTPVQNPASADAAGNSAPLMEG